MAPTLYYIAGGPPSMSVLLLIRHLELKNIELRPVEMFKGEHLTPEFLSMNPGHTIPFFKDGDFVLSESRAILQYLVEAYRPESNLLGRFAKKKAKIQEILNKDFGTVFGRLAGLYGPIFKGTATEVPESAKTALLDALATIDLYLRKGYWAAGEDVSVADFSLVANVATAVAFGVDITPYPNLSDWYKRAQSLSGFDEIVKDGAEKLVQVFNSRLPEPFVF